MIPDRVQAFTGQPNAPILENLRKLHAAGARILLRELPEQVLADGGHFERSPMYHALLLHGLLDLVNVLPESEAQTSLVLNALLPSKICLIAPETAPASMILRNRDSRHGEMSSFWY